MSERRRVKVDRRRRRRGAVRGTSTAHRLRSDGGGDLGVELEADHPLAVWMRQECPICREGAEHGETGQQAP